MAKEIVIAQGFGVSALVDAFLISMLLPSIVLRSVAVSFSTAIVPAYVRVKQSKGSEAAARLFSSSLVIGSFFLLIALALIYGTGPALLSLVSGKYTPDLQAAISRMFFMLLPMVFISGMSLMFSAVINSERRFTTVALTPVFTAIATIIAVAMFASEFGIYCLVFGVLGGSILELVLLVITCRKHDLPVLPRWSGFSSDLTSVIRQFGPLIFGALLLGFNGIVDQAMAATLGNGSVAALGFGNKIVTVFVSLGTTALATAILPYFSSMVADRDWIAIRHTLKVYIRILVLITVPGTALLIYLSDDLIALVFERGAFSSTDTMLVGRIQVYYLLQVPFHVISMLAVRLIIAMERNKVLMWGTIISVVLNVLLNYLFMRVMGVAGIALSTAFVYMVSFVYLWSMLASFLPKAEITATKSPQ